MVTIRDLFHEIGNKHNKITVSSGVLREYLKRNSFLELSEDELRKRGAKLAAALDDIEKTALAADKLLKGLRKAIYNLVDVDKRI